MPGFPGVLGFVPQSCFMGVPTQPDDVSDSSDASVSDASVSDASSSDARGVAGRPAGSRLGQAWRQFAQSAVWQSCLARWQSHLGYRFPMTWAALGLLVGIQIASLTGLTGDYWCIAAIVVAGLAAGLGRYVKFTRWASGLALLGLVLWGIGHGIAQRPREGDSLSSSATRQPQPIALEAVITSAASWRPNPNYRESDPTSSPWRTRWDVQIQRVRSGDVWQAATAYCPLMIDGRVHDLLPGDYVEVFGEFRGVGPPTNPGGLDWSERLAQRGMFVRLDATDRQQLTKKRVEPAYWLSRSHARAVGYVDRVLNRYVTAGQTSLAAALVFGQREQVDWQAQQELMATGTLHLLAISGLHVEIVAGAIALACFVLGMGPRWTCFWLVLICGCYAGLAGGRPPVLRAVIIVTVFSLARAGGRDARMGNVLGLAAVALMFWRVANITNVGVQLSFLAVSAIAVFVVRKPTLGAEVDPLDKLLAGDRSLARRWSAFLGRWLMSGLRLSVWVWLITCPLVWIHFHVVAPIAIPLNVLVSVPLTISLLAGLLTAVLGFIPPLAMVTGAVCGSLLKCVMWLVHAGHGIEFGHAWLPAPSLGWVLVFYCTVGLWLLLLGRAKTHWLAAILSLMILVEVGQKCTGVRGYMASNPTRGDGPMQVDQPVNPLPGQELRVTFLDVGHGTCVILEMPAGEVWLYDAGHMGAAARSYESIAAALWSLPTARIDTLLVSHADGDHYNAIPGLLERFQIGRMVSTPQFWGSHEKPVHDLVLSVDRLGLQRLDWAAPSQGRQAQVRWRVLHPGRKWVGRNDNAASLCLWLEYAGRKILLPGDLEGDGLLGLVEMPPRGCDILMAPHHGSSTLDPTELLLWCRPTWTVISGNQRALRRSVLAQYSGLTRELAVTFRDGAVQFRIASNGQLQAFRFHQAAWQKLP